MRETEPRKEVINRGDLFFLSHSGTNDIFSGYGLAAQSGRNDWLVGVLMVDRPHPVDPFWLQQIEETFDGFQLVPMTASGEQGIVCRMRIEPDSIPYLQKCPFEKAYPIQEALQPLLEHPPKPTFQVHWSAEYQVWLSKISPPNKLPPEIRAVFKKTGPGCLAVESDIGVVHICHAQDTDIANFADKPVISQWQLIKMPSAPLIRLELIIIDFPDNPFCFESFLNIADDDQEKILAELAGQDNLYLAFYGDDLEYRYANVIPHDIQQWQQLDELSAEAKQYWDSLSVEERDFDQAKAAFMSQY